MKRVVLALALAGWSMSLPAYSATLTTLASFAGGAAGRNPEGGVILDVAGNLYGTTFGGGTIDRGTVFRIDAGTLALTTLASMTATTAFPRQG